MSTKFPPLAGSAFPTEDNISSLFGAKVLIGAIEFFLFHLKIDHSAI